MSVVIFALSLLLKTDSLAPVALTSQCTVSLMTAILNSIRVDARRGLARQLAISCTITSIEVDIFDVEGMDVAWDVAEESKADVDTKISTTSGNHSDTNRWN